MIFVQFPCSYMFQRVSDQTCDLQTCHKLKILTRLLLFIKHRVLIRCKEATNARKDLVLISLRFLHELRKPVIVHAQSLWGYCICHNLIGCLILTVFIFKHSLFLIFVLFFTLLFPIFSFLLLCVLNRFEQGLLAGIKLCIDEKRLILDLYQYLIDRVSDSFFQLVGCRVVESCQGPDRHSQIFRGHLMQQVLTLLGQCIDEKVLWQAQFYDTVEKLRCLTGISFV